jgi:diguanylate cyclase (GGDEF)-like protein
VGREEYRFATLALRAGGHIKTLKLAIAGLCMSMAVLGWIVELHPMGPHGTTALAFHVVATSSPLLVGARWAFGRWPSYPWAVAFVVWADVTLAVCASLLSAPPARLCATVHMGLIGLFAAFLLGKRVLALHCLFSIAVIVGLTTYSVAEDGVSWFDLYIYVAPAISSVVVMPVALQAVIEGGRRMAQTTARDAIRDPMTGLYNRRGMYVAARDSARARHTTLLVVAVVDLDDFKRINDIHGHHQGDAAIRAMTDALRKCVRRGDVLARTGGDEFVYIAAMASESDLSGVVGRIRDAARTAATTVTASVGIASATVVGRGYTDADLDAVMRRADTAMYAAKRRGGNAIRTADDLDAPPGPTDAT